MAKVTGFFTSDQLYTVGINGPSSGECEECQLHLNCKSPRTTFAGEGKKRILIVGQCPSSTADKTGDLLKGDATELLRGKLAKLGINLDVDCWKTEAICCNPGKDKNDKERKITRKHIKSCKPRLMKAINDLKPLHIWLMGDDAITSYFMERESKCTVDRFRALCIPDPDKKAWIVPLYHPSYALKMEKDDHFMSTFDRDLKFAVKCSSYSMVPEHVALGKDVTILKEYNDVVRELESVIRQSPAKLAHDYETNSLKPYRKGCKIASISFCYDYDKSFSFPYEYRSHFTKEQITNIGNLWVEILCNPKIKKISHNSKFEDTWSREMFGVDTENMWWCTMNTAHILDNRSDICSLDFQALIRWGVPNYDTMAKYKKADKTAHLNKIMDAPLNDLLLYGGIDSLLTFRLQEEQEEDIKPFKGMQRAREFFMEGLTTLCDIQENGINMDRQYYLKQDEDLEIRIKDMEDALYKFPEAVKFERIKKRPIKFTSSQDLAELFFDILGLPRGKQTDGGNDCTDASVLAELNTPIAKELTKIAQLRKVKGTYLGQFLREIDDDERMRPFFDLHVPRTFRGSSNNPNFQNVPIRNEEAKIITRSGIMPSLGNKLIDFDYGAMEVRIIACYTKDPVLMKYIFDESTDMHRDMAIDIFKFGKLWDNIPGKLGKKIRFEAKNGATFPWFYGSYYRSIARNLFAKTMDMICYDGITVFEHLRSVGIIKNKSNAYEDFEAHIKKVEERFWHKFCKVKAWQEQAWKDYLKNGYVDQMFGFRCSGWLSRNDVVNYPIQGTAFHCLMWTINHINKILKAQFKSLMNGQIHDCCLIDLYPPEQQQIMKMCQKVATQDIREANTWINVPLMIEWEETEINKPWGSKIETREE